MKMNHPAEARARHLMPVQVYPMFETALRASAAGGVEEHQVAHVRAVGRASATVAADNPYAWVRDAEVRRGDPHAVAEQPDDRAARIRSS